MKSSKNCGQSLVEFILIVPIFFLILSGIVSIFYIQNRQFLDFESKISLSLSQFLFEQDERKKANWDNNFLENNEGIKDVLDKSFNPSRAFKMAFNKQDDVFSDKSRVFYAQKGEVSDKKNYTFENIESGEVEISTYAGKNGYEKKGFSFSQVLQNFSPTLNLELSHSLYFPYERLKWNKRPALASLAVKEFAYGFSGTSFAQNFASLFVPDKSKFNGQCFMQPFNPSCLISPYSNLFHDAATQGISDQRQGCLAEVVIECTLQSAVAGPQAVAACVGTKGEEVFESFRNEKQSMNCSALNIYVQSFSALAQESAALEMAETRAKEVSMRINLL